MAGETPSAHAANESRKNLGKGSPAAKPVQPLKRPKFVDRTAVRSTDEYYREGGARQAGGHVAPARPRPAADVNAALQRMAQAADEKKADKRALKVGGALKIIDEKDDIGPVIDAAVERALNGVTGVGVQIAFGKTDLLRRARANLELRVTREEVHEDLAREIHFGYAPAPLCEEPKEAAPGEPIPELPAEPIPAPASTVSIDEQDNSLDPAAFLAAKTTPDELAEAAISAPVAATEFVEPDEQPQAESAPEAPSAKTPAREPEQEAPKPRTTHRGRRGGRGA